MHKMLHTTLTLIAILGLVVLLGQTAPAQAAFEKEETEIKVLMDDGKYLAAANYINDSPDLRDKPKFVRLYTHILTTKYVYTINFKLFALRDVKKGERLEDLRGKEEGTYQMIGGPLDDMLYQNIKKYPDSPYLNFAVGEYLSRGQTCGCRKPGPPQ